MVCAGADAGVYELRAMAFETVESMIRAGACFFFWHELVLKADSRCVRRCHSYSDVFHTSVPGLVRVVKTVSYTFNGPDPW